MHYTLYRQLTEILSNANKYKYVNYYVYLSVLGQRKTYCKTKVHVHVCVGSNPDLSNQSLNSTFATAGIQRGERKEHCNKLKAGNKRKEQTAFPCDFSNSNLNYEQHQTE